MSRAGRPNVTVEYVDTGCDLAPSCLACPLSRCRYDEPPAHRQAAHHARWERIRALFEAGHAIADIAATEGVAKRTVWRALKETR